MIIYLVFKKGICVYVGQTIQTLSQRKGKHFSDARKGKGSVFGAAIRKHGESAFGFVEYLKCSDQVTLDLHEKKLIAELKPRYNVQNGGKANFNTWNKGRKEDRPEVLQNISNAAKTRKRTKRGKYTLEHKTKIAISSLQRMAKPFICHQTGKVYFNKTVAAAELNLNVRSLSVLLSRKTRLKSLKGYTFSYLSSAQDKPTLIDLETPIQGDKGEAKAR